jgi:hypothetical protein
VRCVFFPVLVISRNLTHRRPKVLARILPRVQASFGTHRARGRARLRRRRDAPPHAPSLPHDPCPPSRRPSAKTHLATRALPTHTPRPVDRHAPSRGGSAGPRKPLCRRHAAAAGPTHTLSLPRTASRRRNPSETPRSNVTRPRPTQPRRPLGDLGTACGTVAPGARRLGQHLDHSAREILPQRGCIAPVARD